MSAAVAVLGTLGSDQWNAEVYGFLSVASRLASLVKSRTLVIRLALVLRKLNRNLDEFLEEFTMTLEGKIPPKEVLPGPIDLERARDSIAKLRDLIEMFEAVYEHSKRVRLTNNSIIAGPLNRLHAHTEHLTDIADWLETAIAPQDVMPLFERGREEKKRGDIFDLAQAK